MDRGSSGGSWAGDEASYEEVSAKEEISTEMSVDFEAQYLVYLIVQEAALSEKTPLGTKLEVSEVKHLYAWLAACKSAISEFDEQIERMQNDIA
jgi:hypothetical protein